MDKTQQTTVITRLQRDRGLTGADLAQLAGVDASYISYLAHRRRRPSMIVANRIAMLLGVKPSELWGVDGLARYDRQKDNREPPRARHSKSEKSL